MTSLPPVPPRPPRPAKRPNSPKMRVILTVCILLTLVICGGFAYAALK